MENQITDALLYHEAGRVVFAYLNGYTCDEMEVPGTGSGGGSKLNSGSDAPMVQAIFAGSTTTLSDAQRESCVDVAKKLMTITCAGLCAEAFFENGGQVPAELNIEMPGAEFRQTEKIMEFLRKNSNERDLSSESAMADIFAKLQDKTTWKAITMLAARVMKTGDRWLSRFYIEDTLMAAGMNMRRPAANANNNVGVHEGNDHKSDFSPAEPKAPRQHSSSLNFEMPDASPLHIMLKDFLQRIKKDWREDELNGAIKYLDDVYRKYGGS